MNKFEVMKAAKDGLDVWPDLLAYAAADTPVAEIPEDVGDLRPRARSVAPGGEHAFFEHASHGTPAWYASATR